MAIVILGNGHNLSVSDDGSNGDLIILGNGANDSAAAASSEYDTIILGNGERNVVNAAASQYDTIILGNGRGDAVNLFGGFADTIILGNGDHDSLSATPNLSDFSSKYDTITFGNGAADTVNLYNSQSDIILLGNGAGDKVSIEGGFPSSGDTCAYAKPLRRRSTRRSALNRANDTPAKVIRIWPYPPAPLAGQKHELEPSRFGNPLRFNPTEKCASGPRSATVAGTA